jgi:hypothetical protein
MRNRRRNWLLRRLVLGLAVAAIITPTAQARVDEGGSAQSDDSNGALIRGDDKVIVESEGILVSGDDKVFAPAPESDGVLVKGDDKVFAPAPESDGVLVKGDDKVFAPAPESDGILVSGDDKVFAPVPGSDLVYLVTGDDKVIPTTTAEPIQATPGRPAGRQVPLVATGTGSDFNWADALIGAMAALGLALLAYTAARSTRNIRRPAAN